MSTILEVKKIHMVGIAGVGMSALAQLLHDQGKHVTGSDMAWSPTLQAVEKLGIEVKIGQVPQNVPEDADMVVYTDAAKPDNVERGEAARLGIPQISYFEALGMVSEGKRTVAIAGTHGKTTTTGMLAKILHDANVSPTAIVGSIVQDFNSNYLHGDSDIFVVEACEYQRHFLHIQPWVLVVTNIEFDHTDYFTDLADVQQGFHAFMQQVPKEGFIVTDTKHPNIAPILTNLKATIIDFADAQEYELRLPGGFNQMNARAAAAAARAIAPHITEDSIATSLSHFHGTWRRFQYKGTAASGAEVYDDYAHHPTAVRETITALREKMKADPATTNGKLYIAFHPHLYSRTRDLLEDFSMAFTGADEVLIAPIYAAREEDDGTVSSELLAERIRATGTQATAYSSFEAMAEQLHTAKPGDVIMTMGAGDIYKLADALAH